MGSFWFQGGGGFDVAFKLKILGVIKWVGSLRAILRFYEISRLVVKDLELFLITPPRYVSS